MQPQAMDHVPPTPTERQRNKGHFPWVGVALVVGLFFAGVLFFLLPLLSSIQMNS